MVRLLWRMETGRAIHVICGFIYDLFIYMNLPTKNRLQIAVQLLLRSKENCGKTIHFFPSIHI